MRASAPTYEGITSGSARSTRHTARNGRLVRVTNHAAVVPRTAHGTDTRIARVKVRVSGPSASSDFKMSIASAPRPSVRTTRYTSGAANSAATTTAPTANRRGGRVRRALTARTGTGSICAEVVMGPWLAYARGNVTTGPLTDTDTRSPGPSSRAGPVRARTSAPSSSTTVINWS